MISVSGECKTCGLRPEEPYNYLGECDGCGRQRIPGYAGGGDRNLDGNPNPKDLIGVLKPSISKVPPVAILHEALAMMDGATKYGAYNWREHPVLARIYVDAALRHIFAWHDGEEFAADSGIHHLGHARACLAILLDAQETGNLKDDRPKPGTTSAFITAHTLTRAKASEEKPPMKAPVSSLSRIRSLWAKVEVHNGHDLGDTCTDDCHELEDET